MEEKACPPPTLPFRPVATLAVAAVLELGFSISLVLKAVGKNEDYMESCGGFGARNPFPRALTFSSRALALDPSLGDPSTTPPYNATLGDDFFGPRAASVNSRDAGVRSSPHEQGVFCEMCGIQSGYTALLYVKRGGSGWIFHVTR
jgi:hypothetical protein